MFDDYGVILGFGLLTSLFAFLVYYLTEKKNSKDNDE
jgi:hypothetical protein